MKLKKYETKQKIMKPNSALLTSLTHQQCMLLQ